MRKGSDVIGKPVVAFDSGEQLHRVQDLLFDQENNQLLGFLVDEGGWFSTARVVPLQNIQSIGVDAVIIPARNTVLNADQVPQIKRVLERNNALKGTKIMTTDGRNLGTLIDLYFDETSGVIEGYEVSGGLFADAYTGRSFVPAPQTVKIGQDVAFVPPDGATMMEEQVGGIKAAVQSAGDTLQSATDQATAAVRNAAVDPAEQRAYVLDKTVDRDVTAPSGVLLVSQGQRVTSLAVDEAERQGVLHELYVATGGSLTAGVRGAVGGAVAGNTLEQAKGRRVQQTVRTDGGVVIAAVGQIVTDPVIERARTYNREQELLAAVGLSSGDAARAQTGAALSSAGEKLDQAAQQTREGASNLWDRVKEKVSDLQERDSAQAEETRIKHALGRPVNRVILDRQDQVILNVGELITNQAVTDARQSGVLDILLSSVYDKAPELSESDMRAPESGRDALESREQSSGA